MKWLKDIKARTKLWLNFQSGFSANTVEKPDDTAMITACFAVYLQKIAVEKNKPIPAAEPISIINTNGLGERNLKPTEQPLRTLSPLKQVI